ncbi:MAG TPA: FtsX-like permease family protein [Geminicoccus sp.]|uniref:FtsX-like permease family protein n=1 Tax=Geminicoccus sp. TaxID=2024832 RepID=UPI002BC423E5|nr:FtsX-like permease family protein [Geminicoccus sp.]HWL70301.1 FtsX-like permease family protein [Geminicoccus sp.]
MSTGTFPTPGWPTRGMVALLLGLLVLAATVGLALAAAGHGLLLVAEDRSVAVAVVSLPAPLDPADRDGDLAGVMALLRADPQVGQVELIPEAEVREVLVGGRDADLPMPILLEARFDPGVVPDLARLHERITALAPDGLIEDAGIIGPRPDPALLALLRYAMPALGAGTLLLALLLAAVLTADAVRRRHGEIEVLRMLGADDPFVLRELRPYPFRPLWLGGLAGAGLGAFAMLMLAEAGPAGSWPVQTMLAVRPLDAAILVLGALVVVLAVMLAARQTASAMLRRLP